VFGADDAVLSGNLISANRADSGGGLELYQSDTTLISNTISANTASNAALVLYYSNAALSENIIVSNTSGCGLVMRRSNATLTSTVVTDNRSATTGGCGLSIVDGSQPQLVHTTIARNGGGQGTGVNVSTFASQPATATLTNTIVSAHFWGIYIASGNTVKLEGTLWYSNTVDQYGAGFFISGTHNYWGDPRFAADGYHLLSGSSAIDRGINAGVNNDIDGDVRPQGGGFDLGADEVIAYDWYDIYLPLIIRS
jgi:nitrous oxidase accessory protein NosD